MQQVASSGNGFRSQLLHILYRLARCQPKVSLARFSSIYLNISGYFIDMSFKHSPLWVYFLDTVPLIP